MITIISDFMIATQFFFTMCFICFIITFALMVLYATCWDPEQKHYLRLGIAVGNFLMFGSVCGNIAVIIFACFGNTDHWMPGHANNFFGWSFILGIIGSISGVIASILFYVEHNIQRKKRKDLKESQTRFSLELHN